MEKSGLLDEMIQCLCCLPGVGPKSAQRMAFHLLQRDREAAIKLAKILLAAMDELNHCMSCRTYTELEICNTCSSQSRDRTQLCIVENPADQWVIDQAGFFRGNYFVLHGCLSPLDGIGPEELGLEILEKRLAEGVVTEMILATNATVEGEATAFYISDLAKKFQIRASRLAQGVPLGGELEFIDSGTLNQAFNGRKML